MSDNIWHISVKRELKIGQIDQQKLFNPLGMRCKAASIDEKIKELVKNFLARKPNGRSMPEFPYPEIAIIPSFIVDGHRLPNMAFEISSQLSVAPGKKPSKEVLSAAADAFGIDL